MSDGPAASCGKLPIPLIVCPTCAGGIKPTRSWTWVDAAALAKLGGTCQLEISSPLGGCPGCPLGGDISRAGLLWIGGKYYPTPADWLLESREQGVSRRIPHVPKDFRLGETWVLVAHREAIQRVCQECAGNGQRFSADGNGATEECGCDNGYVSVPAVFHAFKPTAVECVLSGRETDEEIDALVKRGLTPVLVERDEPAETNGDGKT